jgi:hypothetical protein
MLSAIDPEIEEDVLLIFSILAVAARPLTEIELGTILGISKSQQSVKRSRDVVPFRNLGEILEKHVPELIALRDDNTVTFVHPSFKKCLSQPSGKISSDNIIKGHRHITRASLKYLGLGDMLDDAWSGDSFESK